MAKWIEHSAQNHEILGSNPSHGEVFFFWAFFFFLTSLSVTARE
jgi:hypothetical protein